MKMGSAILGVAVIAVAAGGAYWFSMQPAANAPGDTVGIATPPGITLAATRASGTVYGNARGTALYTYDKDTQPGKSVCNDDCAKAWPPMVAPADAKPSGDWSIITRDDATKQWALKGKPVYGFAKDFLPGDSKGNGVGEVWHAASLNPTGGMALPDGIGVREVADAGGQVLVDAGGMTLYAFDGDVKRDEPACAAGAACINHWTPLAAAELANPQGDFTAVSRSDGTRQRAYKGRALYTFVMDALAGDAKGQSIEKGRHVALLMRYFSPADATVMQTRERGGVWTTTAGKTLYARDKYRYSVGGFSLRGGNGERGIPGLGMLINTTGCDEECVKTWHPYLAPADAQPSGYWSIATRKDGAKQWVYQGYALYTYDGDKKAGDMTGNDVFDLTVGDDAYKIADANNPVRGAGALYWRAATP